MGKTTSKNPRTEKQVLKKISDWCKDKMKSDWAGGVYENIEVQKNEYDKLLESTGKKKIIDGTIIGKYTEKYQKKRKERIKDKVKGCLISELEFEEHCSKRYNILTDMLTITVPLRKLPYWRNDIPQYYIKIDKDDTPFMINYREIYKRRNDLSKMPKQGKWQRNDQITRIDAAVRKNRESNWPEYVIQGWDNIFEELNRVVELSNF